MATGRSRPPSGASRGGRARGTPNKDKTELRAMTQEAVLEFTELRREQIRRLWRDEGWRIGSVMGVAQLVPPPSPGSPGWQAPTIGDEISDEVLDQLQPLIDEYDPVVELSLIAVDNRNDVTTRRQAHAEAAQYLRPKLKSIEILEDPESIELQNKKAEMAERMVDILDAMAQARRGRGENV